MGVRVVVYDGESVAQAIARLREQMRYQRFTPPDTLKIRQRRLTEPSGYWRLKAKKAKYNASRPPPDSDTEWDYR